MSTLLITGATGFIGEALCKRVTAEGARVRATIRTGLQKERVLGGIGALHIESIGPDTDWTHALDKVDVIVHLAARVHVMQEKAEDSLQEYRRVNVEGTQQLARAAINAGVKRFVYISSVKVNGEHTNDIPFTERDKPNPQDPYSISKLEAEQSLRAIAQKAGLEVVILRPPLVYGPGVRANFLQLMKLVYSGVPLPLGGIGNARSLIYLGNLVDAIMNCIQHPGAANKTFLVSDGEDLSTPELIRRLASALNKPARLVPVPPSLLRLAGAVTRKSAEVERLTGSLVIDSSKIRRELNWTPPFTVDEGLKRTAEWYVEAKRKVGA
ncbi:MAG: SDR family oxidoreductase [Nitrospirota bacterium]